MMDTPVIAAILGLALGVQVGAVVVYVGALVHAARRGRWMWFGVTLLLPPVAVVYLFGCALLFIFGGNGSTSGDYERREPLLKARENLK